MREADMGRTLLFSGHNREKKNEEECIRRQPKKIQAKEKPRHSVQRKPYRFSPRNVRAED